MTTVARARQFAVGGALARRASHAHGSWPRRDGLVYELTASDGVDGQGEASPLPGYSRETLAECHTALAALPGVGRSLPGEGSFAALLIAAGSSSALPPAARCAFEGALLDLVARRRGIPAWQLLTERASAPPPPRPLSTLLHATTPAAIAAEAGAVVARGVGCLKLKIGRPGALAAELELARAVRAAASGVALRLDANRAFLPAEAPALLARFAPLGCELVEEPVAGLDLAGLAAADPAAWQVARALGELPLPFALDESLQAAPPGALALLARHALPVAVVLKPMVLGGLARSLVLAAEAESLGLDVIVTHSFDGPLGLQTAAALALAVGSTTRGHGLAPHPGLDAWPPRALPAVVANAVVPWREVGLGIAPFTAELAP